MASVTITISIPEQYAAKAEKALCNYARLPVSGANAKRVLAGKAQEWINGLIRREAEEAAEPISGVE